MKLKAAPSPNNMKLFKTGFFKLKETNQYQSRSYFKITNLR